MFGVSSTILSGGSLGSCVDEERSQLCELMRTAYCSEHRLLERILRPWVSLWPRLSEGRPMNYHGAHRVVVWVLPGGMISPLIVDLLNAGCRLHGFSRITVSERPPRELWRSRGKVVCVCVCVHVPSCDCVVSFVALSFI